MFDADYSGATEIVKLVGDGLGTTDIPLISQFGEGMSGVASAIQGDWTGTLLSAGSMFPLLGKWAEGVKFSRKAYSGGKKARRMDGIGKGMNKRDMGKVKAGSQPTLHPEAKKLLGSIDRLQHLKKKLMSRMQSETNPSKINQIQKKIESIEKSINNTAGSIKSLETKRGLPKNK